LITMLTQYCNVDHISKTLQNDYLCGLFTRKMISLNNINLFFGADPLFEDVSFLINRTDRIGLCGRNGAGKSTLLKIIKGLNQPTSGQISVPKDATIGYLPQEFHHTSSLSILEETQKAFEKVVELQDKIDDINIQLGTRDDYESDAYMKLITDLHDFEDRYRILGGYEMEEKTEKILKGLGFTQEDLQRSMSEFSGGWQMRVELAKILLQQPDLVLLDEPTNHLDIESIMWLEEFLVDYPGAIVMISHDRTFLDKITNRTIEITNGSIQDYKANYSKYLILRKERREKLENSKKNQDQQIAQMERNIEKFRAKASKASFAQSLIKKLDKIERIEMDIEDLSSINIRFIDPPRSGKVVVNAENLSKNYGDKEVIKPMTFTIDAGEKIAFVGKNGMGKTTLSRMIAGDLDYKGEITIGHNVKLGYFAQHQTNRLDNDNTILKEMENTAYNSDSFTKIRGILGAFLFSGEDVEKKIKVLSGGEKSRVSMAKLLLEPINFLILDEPTNHLDIVSKEVLKQAIQNFQGTVIIVSHDRDFLQGLTTKIFEFTPVGIREHLCDINEFLAKKNAASFREIELNKKMKQEVKKVEAPKPVNTSAKDQNKKPDDKELKRVKNALQNTEKRIEDLESEIKTMDEQLADPSTYQKIQNDSSFFSKYNSLKSELEKEMSRWEELQMEVEKHL
jgi:ATP-binding cassette subfamily F protein 3